MERVIIMFIYELPVLSPEEASRIQGISVFRKRLSRKSDNVVISYVEIAF